MVGILLLVLEELRVEGELVFSLCSGEGGV